MLLSLVKVLPFALARYRLLIHFPAEWYKFLRFVWSDVGLFWTTAAAKVVAVVKLDVSSVIFIASLPVSVEKMFLGKNSRHRIHFDEPFHRSTRSFSPAPVLFTNDSCNPEADTFSAWPESDTLKTLSKSRRFRIWPFRRLLPVTPDTVSAGCFASNRLSVADCVYAVFVSNSWPVVASVRDSGPATCKRFNSLFVRNVDPVTLASVRDAELPLIKPVTSDFV